MEIKSILFEPRAEVEITPEELKQLWASAETHYDFTCRQTAERGGILWGVRNRMESNAPSRYFDMGEIDLLAKVAESPKCCIHIHSKLVGIFRTLTKESERVNAKASRFTEA